MYYKTVYILIYITNRRVEIYIDHTYIEYIPRDILILLYCFKF